MKAIEMEKSYQPKDFENRIYQLWEQGKYFEPQQKSAGGNPYVIVIPPPNVTGVLHLGHGLNNSLQDVLTRYHRMKGDYTLWVPGTDHAGIATQNIVEKKLRAQGKERIDLGREAFLEETWKVKDEHHAIITEQLRKIGSSCDWSRERFTLDEGLSQAVREVFVTLYERGLIYKGTYLVNWSTGVQSALSDDEVEFKEVKGAMYHIRYPVEGSDQFVEIATTRPETMLGDTAVAVHPEDKRYEHLHGKKIRLPLTDRLIPVVLDDYVDREFGTGVVKITPAHDFNDYELGKRHNLEEINIINPDGTLNDNVPEKYQGMTMQDARKLVVADLEDQELFVKSEVHVHQVGHCYRTNTVIEPYLSTQWFVKMKPLADKALKAWEDGDITFYPRKWENTYSHWMKNIRDWCISRQLWWGHRIPVWYDEETGEMIVSRTDPSEDPKYAGRKLRQDEDVLDTWFSSWLWPFSVMGWPEKTEDLKAFYPTTSLVSAYDIIFFWIARMVMAGLEFLGEVPFKDIYVTGLVRDKKGRKMSKSLGNGLDPLEIVDEYGSDSLRFTLSFLAAQGQDILLDKETFGLGSRFANKIWNASRYLLMNLEGRKLLNFQEILSGKHGGLTNLDKWILTRVGKTAEAIRTGLEAYRFNDASAAAYEFFWNDFCDWYIEASKLSLYQGDDAEKDRAVSLLLYVLEEGLKLLHPFLPFLTEEIFQKLPQITLATENKRVLIVEEYPQLKDELNFTKEEQHFSSLQELVRSVRTLRSEFNIPPGQKIKLAVKFDANFESQEFVQSQKDLIDMLTNSQGIEFVSGDFNKEGSIAAVGKGFETFVFIREFIDIDEMLVRLEKKIQKESKALDQTEKKLSNQGFLSKASNEVIENERKKREEMSRQIEIMEGYVEDLKR